MSHSKNIQIGMFYGNGYDVEKSNDRFLTYKKLTAKIFSSKKCWQTDLQQEHSDWNVLRQGVWYWKICQKDRHWEDRRQQSYGKSYGTKKFNNDDSIGTISMIKVHGKYFYGKISAVESPTLKTMTFIGYLKHVSSVVDEISSCGTRS